LKSALFFIFFTVLIDVIGFGIIIPVFPRLIMGLTGGTFSQAAQWGGWLMFAYSFTQFFFAPIVGALSDMYGRRPVILASLFAFGVDYILLGFAPNIYWLFLGRMLAGLTGASFSAAGAYIADVSEPEKRAQNFGIIGAAFGLGFIIGPAIGGGLAELGKWMVIHYPNAHFMGFDINYWGIRLPFFAAAFLAIVNWLYGYFILPESLKPENRRPFDWKRANPVGTLVQMRKYPVVIGMMVPLGLIYISNYATQSVWSYFTMYKFHWSEMQVGLSLMAVGISAAIVQGGLTRTLIPKWGVNKSVFIGISFAIATNILYALAPEGWMMYFITFIGAIGGIMGPALQGIASNAVGPEAQGELRGAQTSLMSLCSIIGPLLMTNLFALFTAKTNPIQLPSAPFWAAGILCAVSLVFLRKLLKNHPEVVSIAPKPNIDERILDSI
jgi:MFS transporter, DHA1 family, tetracycline resistance protein